MSIFRHRISFSQQDPLDDGLGDMIAAEQSDDNLISLRDEDGQQLTDFWNGVSKNLKKDPDWFDFDNE